MTVDCKNKLKVVIAVTGASGAVYADLLINKINALKSQIEVCEVVFSTCGREVWDYELSENSRMKIPFKVFSENDFFAPFASGSSGYDLMIICPCSMGTLGRIAHGISNDLITRAADVFLKERKKLILVTREMPLNLIHINNMKTITEAGGVICPASPSFYGLEKTAEQVYQTVINKVLSLAGLKINTFTWGNQNNINK